MEKFELTILGCNSAMPAHGRFPTSQILDVSGELLLIDCGEGTQIRMAQYKIKRNQIRYVLISHLHGDHIYGLPGFIGSLSHLSRSSLLRIYGPKGIKEYIETCLRLSQSHISYAIEITEIEPDEVVPLFKTSKFSVSAFPVNHRIPTIGYLIKESPRPINIRKDSITQYNMTVPEIKAIKAGEDLIRDGKTIPNINLTHPRKSSRSYGYCADTKVDGWSKKHLGGVDVLYFETTYLDELRDQAHQRGHSTAYEAGLLAKDLQVGKLVIGHYSSRYRSIDALVNEAKSVFSEVVGGYDGMILNIEH